LVPFVPPGVRKILKIIRGALQIEKIADVLIHFRVIVIHTEMEQRIAGEIILDGQRSAGVNEKSDDLLPFWRFEANSKGKGRVPKVNLPPFDVEKASCHWSVHGSRGADLPFDVKLLSRSLGGRRGGGRRESVLFAASFPLSECFQLADSPRGGALGGDGFLDDGDLAILLGSSEGSIMFSVFDFKAGKFFSDPMAMVG